MLKNIPLWWWVILLSVITISMPEGTFWEIATFWILVGTTIIAIGRWGYPKFRRWWISRAYSISFTDSFESNISSKSKVVRVGEQDIFVKVKMNTPQIISRLEFYFNRADRRDEGGVASNDIISFRHVMINNSENLPYENSLEPNKKFRPSGMPRAHADFTPDLRLKKHENRVFNFTVEAKESWKGLLLMNATDETGKVIPQNLKITIK
jgi:hypothetical protein